MQIIYMSPLRALSQEKFEDWCALAQLFVRGVHVAEKRWRVSTCRQVSKVCSAVCPHCRAHGRLDATAAGRHQHSRHYVSLTWQVRRQDSRDAPRCCAVQRHDAREVGFRHEKVGGCLLRCGSRLSPCVGHVATTASCTRYRWKDNVGILGSVALLLIDEVHVVGDERGAVLEAVRGGVGRRRLDAVTSLINRGLCRRVHRL